MRTHILIFILIIVSFLSFSQSKRGDTWITGRGTKIKFNNNVVTSELNWALGPGLSYFTFGNSAICDTNGNLILCSDGYNVYDSIGNYLDGGDTLVPKDFYNHEGGWSLYSQSSIFLPMDSNKYYFVTPTFSNTRFADCLANNNCHFDLLLYNIIDMNANGGAGKVVRRMVPLMENAELRKTQMMACRHSNGKDWWLIKQAGDSNRIHKFLFQQDTVLDMGFQQFDEPMWGPWDIRGMSTFNADGSKYATTSHGGSTGQIFLADFDRCYGIFSNPKVIYMPFGSQHLPPPYDTNAVERLAVGLAYSPNSELLYVISGWNIYQYDLQYDTLFHVAGLDTSWLKFQQYDASYMGPDGKLYIGNMGGQSKQMSRIDNPDVKGAGCNFCPRCLRLDSLGIYAAAGTPPCMPNYSLGAQECWPLNNDELLMVNDKLEVYPNPANSKLFIKNGKGLLKELYNTLGQLILSTKENEIDVSKCSKGVYYIRCSGQVRKVVVE